MPPTEINGTDSADFLNGTAGDDLIYGFDPEGAQANVTAFAATRVAVAVQPIFAGAPVGDADRLFIVQKEGLIRILDLSGGALQSTPFLDVTAEISAVGESGLLGLAFDPNFASNGFFYVNLINTAGDTEIRRYQVSASNPNIADPNSSTLIISVDQPSATNHKAGWLGFGPDGFLYAALGDGGSNAATAQDVNSLLGKMLRLDVSADAFPGDAGRFYSVPADNPFVGIAGADEIWALGLRNPWRDSFDRGTGDLFIADVGQSTWEEVNLGVRGGNYGWPQREGPYGGTPIGPGTVIQPIHFYPRDVGNSITGGYVYRGESDGLHGQYVFADYSLNRYFSMAFNGVSWVATQRTAQITFDVGNGDRPTSFGEDGRGNLYILTIGGGVFRLTPQNASADQGDTIASGAGVDQIHAGAGNDFVVAGDGADTAYGGAGADVLQGEIGDDILWGDAGDDQILGGAGGDVLNGGDGADVAGGDAGDDVISGGAGADTLYGGDDNDELIGNLGGDGLIGGAGDDVMYGHSPFAAGPDASGNYFYGEDGDDTAFGDAGVDVFIMGAGADTANGGGGQDYFYMGDNADVANGDVGVDVLIGEAGADTLNGGADNDYLYGGVDNDTGNGGAGADLFVMDSGDDVVNGDAGNDFAYGGDGADTLNGGADTDILLGEAGNDVINPGQGVDYVFLGAGADTLVVYSALAGVNVTVLYEFTPGAGDGDVLRLLNTSWTTIAQVQAATVDTGNGYSILTLDADTAIWLVGVTPGQLTAGDVVFT